MSVIVRQRLLEGLELIRKLKQDMQKTELFYILNPSYERDHELTEEEVGRLLDDFVRVGFLDADYIKDEPVYSPSKKAKYARAIAKALAERSRRDGLPVMDNESFSLFFTTIVYEMELNDKNLLLDKEFLDIYEKLLKEESLI